MTLRRLAGPWLLLLLAPLVLALAGRLAGEIAAAGGHASAEDRLRRVGGRLQDEFLVLLGRAADAARRAAAEPSRAAVGLPPLLAQRFEGAGALGADGSFRRWAGTPAEPGPDEGAADGPRWSVRVEGLWTRLVVRSARDGEGRSALASFVLDGPFPGQALRDLLPHAASAEAIVRLALVSPADGADDLGSRERDASGVFRRGERSRLILPLRAPGGEILALATIEEIAAARRVALWSELGQALAALAFAGLLAALFDWPRLTFRARGVAAAFAALAAARAVLLAARVPSRLLPRELGSPTLFGSAEGFGLLGSPADLFLTCLTGFLAWRALRRTVSARDAHSPAFSRVAVPAAALAGGAWLLALCAVLARDARIPLLELGSLARSPAQALLLASVALALVQAAESLAAFFGLRGKPRLEDRAPRWLLAAALVPLAALASLTLLRTREALATERLRSEFAPQVLEQASRRRVALVANVREAALSAAACDAVLSTRRDPDTFTAYLLWVRGDLFHSGYHSSIDLYDAQGARRSRFGFRLPALEESGAALDAGREASLREESYREGARLLRVLHAAAPIVCEGRSRGSVVAHVLDEPDNLPFLPGSSPYLSALGVGAPGPGAEDPDETPGYVLYAQNGAVLVSSLDQPPAPAPRLWEAGSRGHTLRLTAGGRPYLALPLADDERLHLLLLPALSPLDRVGAFLRLCLAGAAALALLALLERSMRPRELLGALGGVRRSFYRKLFASLLVASVIPLLGLAVFVRGYVERRARAALVESASRLAEVVKSVIEDYAAAEVADDPVAAIPEMNDEIFYWLRRVVRQEILLYENGLLTATSKRELFASGLLPARLPGEVQERLIDESLPSMLRTQRMGPVEIPVAYAALRLPGAAPRHAVAAVPLVLELRDLARDLDRVSEALLLATVLLVALLAAGAALLARSVARPVHDLVVAAQRIASGDYSRSLAPRTRDELASLVQGFNAMARALAAQRADLERRRDYIEALLRHATAGVASTDPEGRIVTLNPAAAALLSGPEGAPHVGEPLVEAIARQSRLAPLARALEPPHPPGAQPLEIDLESEGKTRRLRLVRVDLPDPEGGPAGSLILLDDVTELMRSNQLAAWAEMARAIAHEIKNPLTPIQLSTEHLERLLADRRLLPWPEAQACLTTVIHQVRALRQIAGEFSAYAKLPDLIRVLTDPAQLLREVCAPYRVALPQGIALEEVYESVPAVAIDRRVLSRAVINLVENALHAMPEGGTLRVALRHEAARQEIAISVGDTGPGLAPEARSRLFEPYFSTKSAGTGLGLAIVRQAAEAHLGRVEVESESGKGTLVTLHLPIG